MEIWKRLLEHSDRQKNHDNQQDLGVETLDRDSVLILARQTMTLSRRRRCATEHLGGNLTNEGSVAFALNTWYLENGFTKETLAPQILSDLQAILENPTKVSETLKERILLTNYFSRTGELEDCYNYGNIEPFIFEGERTGKFEIRDTFRDKTPFNQRINTIISLNPEIKGFKHQIRYFRALLSTYGLAHLAHRFGVSNPLIDSALTDEKAFASGWLSLDRAMKKFSIDPFKLPPDESLLYDKNKVAESAFLFKMYTDWSRELLTYK